MLNVIIDTILPGDVVLNMPSASAVQFERYVIDNGIEQIVKDFESILEQISFDRFSLTFAELNNEQRLSAVNACKLKNVRVFSTFLTHLLRAYYSSSVVLRCIQVGAIPPFPDGNSLEDDDWSILEEVYERGVIYRDVHDKRH